jgi:hypothetical protein
MPIVLTIDQRGGRRRRSTSPDLVDEWNKAVNEQYGDRLTLPFERTVGDETQALMNDAAVAIELVLRASRDHKWWVGMGVGEVELPLGQSARASTGLAFFHAREAVDMAKRRRSGIAVRGADGRRQEHVETVLDLLAALTGHRSRKAWEAVDLRREGATIAEVAAALGVSRQAIQERLRRANAEEEDRAIKLVVDLLQELEQSPESDHH